MRAILLREFGPPERLVLEDVPAPVAGPGEALIDVAIANITFVETQIRAGRPPSPAMAPVLPAIPGNGVGGVVAEAGEGADPGLVGTRVVSSTGGSGAYAERVAVPAAGLIEVPEALELPEAVALLADGRTATGLIRAAAVQPGETVLVHAAAGGVGSLLVQLAAGAGASVVGAAGGARKLQVARELGADVTVDYTEPGWTRHLEPVDVVLDGVGGEIALAAFGRVRDGGRFCPFGGSGGSFAVLPDDERGVTLVRMGRPTPEESLELTRSALAEAVAGRLRALIGQTYPLERAADAHAAIEARATIGKTLLTV